jgi:hypothetical protein
LIIPGQLMKDDEGNMNVRPMDVSRTRIRFHLSDSHSAIYTELTIQAF